MPDSKLTTKLEEICDHYGITVCWIEPLGQNRANRGRKTIWVREIEGSGDFAAALHEAGHVICDPEHQPQTHREKLDAETNAWQRALEENSNSFDAIEWGRLHESLHQYYVSVMDPAHRAHILLVRAEQEVPTIRARVSTFGTPNLHFGSKKNTKAQS